MCGGIERLAGFTGASANWPFGPTTGMPVTLIAIPLLWLTLRHRRPGGASSIS